MTTGNYFEFKGIVLPNFFSDTMFGDLRHFVFHYYLVDDTLEIREVYKANDGRDPFPVLLRRQKLPKDR